jgi:hypothetical protein
MLNRCSYIVNADPTAEKIALLRILNQVCEHLEASGLVDRSSGLTFMRPAVNEINLNASIERLERIIGQSIPLLSRLLTI